MLIEFLHVSFPGDAVVMANDKRVGVTNHTLMLPADEYKIVLKDMKTTPVAQDVVLTGTSIVRPKVISFAAA